MPNGTIENSVKLLSCFKGKAFLVWGSWDLAGRFPSPSRSQMLSPKIIYFDSMKNLTHATKDVNITDSLKASVFYLGEKFTSCSFQWLRRGSEHLISHQKGSFSAD